jgi:hypothetical protein
MVRGRRIFDDHPLLRVALETGAQLETGHALVVDGDEV